VEHWPARQICAPVSDRAPELRAGADRDRLVVPPVTVTVRAVGAGHSFTGLRVHGRCDDRHVAMNRILEIDRARVWSRSRRSRTPPARPLSRITAWHSRTGRHRRAVGRRRDLHRDAWHRRRLPESRRASVALRLVTAAGEVLELSPETDPEGLPRGPCSVGRAGVISALTIACVPLTRCTATISRSPSTRHWPSRRARRHHDHFEFFVFPYCDTALTRRNPAQSRGAEAAAPLEALATGTADREQTSCLWSAVRAGASRAWRRG